MSKERKLLPCPFCGKPARLDAYYWPQKEATAGCNRCGMITTTYKGKGATNRAISRWNRRAAPQISR